MSEDLCQLRAGYDLCSYTQKIDCEDDAQHAETVAKAFMKLKRDLKNMSNTPLDQIISERFFGKADNPENIQFIQAVNNLCEQVGETCFLKTCNVQNCKAEPNKKHRSSSSDA